MLLGAASIGYGEPPDSSTDSRALVQGAMADFNAKKYDDALGKLNAADKLSPKDPFVLNLLGAVYTKKKDFPTAKQYFERALAKQPGFFPAKFNIGELIFLDGRYGDALDFFRQLLQESPNSELLQFKVFLCEFKLVNKEHAEKALNSVRYPVDTPAWYFAQAAWALQKGDKKKAHECVEGARYIFGAKTAMFEESCQDIGLDLH